MHRFMGISTAALSCFLVLAGCNQGGGTSTTAQVQPLAENATAVRLEATIYQIRMPADKIAELDATRLAAADFSQPLADLGQPVALYRVDQRVSLAGDKIVVGTQEPMVTNTRMTDRGQRINSVQYNDVGALFAVKGERAGPRELRVTLDIELSTSTDSPVQVSEGVSTPVIRKSVMSLKGPVDLGKPALLISADASSRDKDDKAVVHVTRVVLGGV